jgi:serine/threonine-protein kinase RsbW
MSAEVVRLTIPAKPEYLILARLALAGIAREIPMSETVVADLKLAVTEACGNAVRHAYAADRGVVRVRYEMTPDEIEICVEDDGAGTTFEPETASLDVELDEPPDSGMGLAIIRAVVDELALESGDDGGGTVVRMRKRLRG